MSSPSEVELTIVAAKDLKNINWKNGTIRPYAVVWVDPNKKVSSRVDEEGDAFPFWDQELIIPIPPGSRLEDQTIYIDVVHANRDGEKTKPIIGSTRVSFREILDDAGTGERRKRSLQLKRPSGRPQGKIDVKVQIKQNSYKAKDYQSAYDVPPPSQSPAGYSSYAFPAPPQQPSGYGMPYVPPLAQEQPSNFSSPYSAARQASGYGAPYAPQPPSSGYSPPYAAAPTQGYYYSQGVSQPTGYPYTGAPGQSGYGQGYSGYGQQSGTIPGYGAATGAPIMEGEKKKSKFGGMGTGLAVGAVAGALGGLALAEGFDALEDKIADDVAEKVEDDYYDDGDF